MISQSQYVAITSGVGGAAQVSNREQILRVCTTAAQMPTETVLEYTSAQNVGNYFGFNSQEYAIAQSYFSYVNNYQQSPSKISFYADVSQGKAPFLWGTQEPAALTDFTSISDGAFVLSMGGVTETISGLSFSSASSYTQIAETIQTAIQAAQSSNNLWSQATFVYDSITSSFVLTGGAAEEAAIVALSSPSSGTDISGLLRDKDDDSTLIQEVRVSEIPSLKAQGIISGGMIPKIDCCVEAVRRGVSRTNIIDGRIPHSILIELFTNAGIGTMFLA